MGDGAGVVEQVSLDLQREFPNADGFSTTNLWYMKQWYLFYYQEDAKLQQLGAEIGKTKLHQVGGETESLKLHQFGGESQISKMHQHGAVFEQLKERMELLQKEMRETKRLMKSNK